LTEHDTAEVRLGDLKKVQADVVDLAALKAAGLVPPIALRAKVFLAGTIERKVALQGLRVSKGARAAIEAAGGSVELPKEEKTPAKLSKKAAPSAATAEAK